MPPPERTQPPDLAAAEPRDDRDRDDDGGDGDGGDGGDARLAAEARRLHLRYTVEIVERLSLCPFARAARARREVERHVLLQRTIDAPGDLDATLALIAALEQGTRPPVAIAIYPRVLAAPRAFDEFAARVKSSDQARHGGAPVYVSATFHPDYPLAPAGATRPPTPPSIVPFLRRSPDPSLQLVRLDVLEAARGEAGGHGTFVFDGSAAAFAELERRLRTRSVEERIAADNFATLAREGVERLEASFRELRADRAATYARLGLA